MRVPFPVASPPAAHTAASQPHAKPTLVAEAIRISIGREYSKEGKNHREAKVASETMGQDENEWMLGRALLIEDMIPEDVVLLMHHLVSTQSRIKYSTLNRVGSSILGLYARSPGQVLDL